MGICIHFSSWLAVVCAETEYSPNGTSDESILANIKPVTVPFATEERLVLSSMLPN